MAAWFSLCKLVHMTRWLTEENWETVLGLVTEGCIVVSDCMVISILSMLVEPLEILWAEGADALSPRTGDLITDDLLSPLYLMFIFKKLNTS